MKLSTSDKTTGKIHEVKGAIRQAAGQVTGNPDLEADGKAEKIAGKIQNFVGKVEKAAGK
ncbi:MAG: CsbD family protein [Terracidiphilus sp.]